MKIGILLIRMKVRIRLETKTQNEKKKIITNENFMPEGKTVKT